MNLTIKMYKGKLRSNLPRYRSVNELRALIDTTIRSLLVISMIPCRLSNSNVCSLPVYFIQWRWRK